MSQWLWMITSSKRHLKSWVVKCGQRWEKNLPGTKMENWPNGKRVGGSSLLPFPQHHFQSCVQWAYSLRNCTTEKWRRSETRTERNALTVCCLTMRLQHARTRWFAWPVSGQDTGVPSATSHYQEQEVTPLTSTRREGKPQILSPLTLPKPLTTPPPPPPHHPALTQKPSLHPRKSSTTPFAARPGREGEKGKRRKKREGKCKQSSTPYFTRRGTRPTSGSASGAVARKEKRRRRTSGSKRTQPAPQKKMQPQLTRRWKRAVGLRKDNKYTPPVYDPLSTYATPNRQRDPISDTDVMLTVQWRTHYV